MRSDIIDVCNEEEDDDEVEEFGRTGNLDQLLLRDQTRNGDELMIDSKFRTMLNKTMSDEVEEGTRESERKMLHQQTRGRLNTQIESKGTEGT